MICKASCIHDVMFMLVSYIWKKKYDTQLHPDGPQLLLIVVNLSTKKCSRNCNFVVNFRSLMCSLFWSRQTGNISHEAAGEGDGKKHGWKGWIIGVDKREETAGIDR